MKTKQFFTILLLLLSMKAIYSCDCKPTSTVEEEINSTSLVIRGHIIKAEYHKKLDQDKIYLDSLSKKIEKVLYPAILNEYTVVVKKAFKGAIENDTLIIRTALDPVTDCGLILKSGADYIFYSYKIKYGNAWYGNSPRAVFATSVCNRTRLYSKKEVEAIRNVIGSH